MNINSISANNLEFSTKNNQPQKKLAVTNPNFETSSKNFDKSFEKYSKAQYTYFQGLNSVNFGGATTNFRIKKLENVPCPCCGQVMLTENSIEKHINRLNKAKGDKLADRIYNEEAGILRSNQRAAAFIIADCAKGTEMSITQAARKANENLPNKFISYCKDVLMNAAILSDEQSGENSELGQILFEKADKLEDAKSFYRPDLTEELSAYRSVIGDEKYNKIEDVLMTLPLNFKEVNRVMSEAQNLAPTEFAKLLLKPSLATAEHIKPKSLGGENTPSNFLSECAGCNNPRSSLPYVDWIKVHPEFTRNPQTYIEHVEERIVNGELPQIYDTYPVDVKETLTNESQGHIKLTVLNKEKILELKEAKKNGQGVNISEETAKVKEEENSDETEKTE